MARKIHEESSIRNVVIEELVGPDVLYPYYRDGYFEGIPHRLSAAGFYELMESASTFMKFYTAYYNGELVCVFECRPIKGRHEVHANWFTDSKRKRAIVLDRWLDYSDMNMVTFVNNKESDGHFAFVRRGKMKYLGEERGMNIFEAANG